MSETKSGLEMARETAARIKGEVKEEKHNALVTLQANKELANLYAGAARLGSENLQGSVPTLKVHTTNKSVGNQLADGSEPNDGWFFHTLTARQFQNPICHILTVSKGFRAKGMVDVETGKVGEPKFNQVLGGLIKDEGDYIPFIMYFTGLRLQPLWDFGKDISKYTKAKPVPIPMFALSVKLSTEKMQHKYGKSSVVVFDVIKDETGFPKLVMDAGEFTMLKSSVESMQDMIKELVDSKNMTEITETLIGEPDISEMPVDEDSYLS